MAASSPHLLRGEGPDAHEWTWDRLPPQDATDAQLSVRGLELLLTVQGHTHAYALPPDADAHAGQATARFHNGALTVTIPKRSGSEEDARRWRLQAAADNRIVHISVSKP